MVGRLNKPIGSLSQFGLATTPLLALFVYFLYQASVRPHTVGDAGSWIPLIDMVKVMLAFLALFATLGVYIGIFIPLRRSLVKSYLQKGQVILGEVQYNEVEDTCLRSCWNLSRYGIAVYAHPAKDGGGTIRKRVRLYQYYSREGAAILCLPDKPFSGQPQTDLELDVAAAAKHRDKTQNLLILVCLWIAFLIISSIYILFQMGFVYNEDHKAGWTLFGIVAGIFIPLVAYGGNLIRWRSYRHWLLYGGIEPDVKESGSTSETPYKPMEEVV